MIISAVKVPAGLKSNRSTAWCLFNEGDGSTDVHRHHPVMQGKIRNVGLVIKGNQQHGQKSVIFSENKIKSVWCAGVTFRMKLLYALNIYCNPDQPFVLTHPPHPLSGKGPFHILKVSNIQVRVTVCYWEQSFSICTLPAFIWAALSSAEWPQSTVGTHPVVLQPGNEEENKLEVCKMK